MAPPSAGVAPAPQPGRARGASGYRGSVWLFVHAALALLLTSAVGGDPALSARLHKETPAWLYPSGLAAFALVAALHALDALFAGAGGRRPPRAPLRPPP